LNAADPISSWRTEKTKIKIAVDVTQGLALNDTNLTEENTQGHFSWKNQTFTDLFRARSRVNIQVAGVAR
jgi:hypothetical protein